MKRLLTLISLTVALVVAGNSAAFACEKPSKVYICHAVAGWGQNNSGYNLLHVSDNALNGHYVDDNRQGPLHSVWNNKFKTMLQDYFPSRYEIKNGCGAKKEITYDTTASYQVCGDPRALILLENYSDVPVAFKVTWVSGKDFVKRSTYIWVAPDETRQVIRWIRGHSFLKVVAIHGDDYITHIKGRAMKAQPWGTGSCPVSLKAATQTKW